MTVTIKKIHLLARIAPKEEFLIFLISSLKKFASKTETDMDENLIDAAKKPAKWIVIFFGFKFE